MNARNVRLITISIVTVAMFAGQLLAGKNQWTSRGPRGGSIETLVADRANPAENGGSSVCRGCNTALNADRPTGQSWETFTIRKVRGIGSGIADGDSISLQSNSGDYVSADRGGSNGCGCDSVLNANRPEAMAWETFTIIMH
jgi:hypothetical protein